MESRAERIVAMRARDESPEWSGFKRRFGRSQSAARRTLDQPAASLAQVAPADGGQGNARDRAPENHARRRPKAPEHSAGDRLRPDEQPISAEQAP